MLQPSLIDISPDSETGTPIVGSSLRPQISTTPEIEQVLAAGAAVAIGVSGGKDSAAVAFALTEYLDSSGHSGPRLLVNADLGRIEWRDSLPTCKRLAEALGLELAVVHRPAGDMMDRWESRWRGNVRRYRDLECVKLIMPFSSAAWRFCTAELKVDPICAELARRYPGQVIISASGIRSEESPRRAKAPVLKQQKKLYRTAGRNGQVLETRGYAWHPILHWREADVYRFLAHKAFPLHEAYRTYGTTRVSCAFCVLASMRDLQAAATCAGNHEIYRTICRLEIASTFSFQDGRWLSDVAPELLTSEMRDELPDARRRARLREEAEAVIPKHLLYVKGWPASVPTLEEARMLCDVRLRVAAAARIPVLYTEPGDLIGRYEALIEEREKKNRQAASVGRKRTARALPVIDPARLCEAA
jgi:3'-phosphoadenosine 5'-phosphosulfate sulfotransferase (PAPS reductase)/FAD synthetase